MPRIPPPFTSSVAPAPAASPDSVVRRIPRTYWLEGGLIGGVVVGALGSQFCKLSDSPHGSCYVEVFLISGAFIGFPAGALIGGQFKKHPANQAESPPPH